MQARRLKKLLETGYIVQNSDEYVKIGSPYVSDIIKISKRTLEVIVWRHAEHSKNLQELLDKIKRLAETGELREIIDGKDEIANPLPVFTYRGGVIVESKTDKYGWPNTDDDGFLFYENNHFKTREECRKYALKSICFSIRSTSEQLEEAKNEVERLQRRVEKAADDLSRIVEEIANV